MLIFLALSTVVWLALFVDLYHITRQFNFPTSKREVFLIATMAVGLLIVISTEGLSLFNLLTVTAIKIYWTAVLVLLLGSVIYLYIRRRESLEKLSHEIRTVVSHVKSASWQNYLIFFLIVVVCTTTLMINQIYQVPTNGDSMRYHLTRTLYWLQNASVRHYATNTLHQITFPPFAEYAILHINALVGGDHLARIVEWISMVVSIVAVSDIAKKIGADSRQQLIASLLTSTNPMVIAQSTSTMNDLVIAAWLLIFVSFGLRLKNDPKRLVWAGFSGLALGLALLAKSTAFIFALPFSIWVAACLLRSEGFRLSLVKTGTLMVVLVLLINLGHFYRNTSTFGSPLGTNLGTVNEEFSLRVLASNTIRNIQMHMPSTDPDNPEIISFIGAGASKIFWTLHQLTGLGPTDPRTTYKGAYVGFESPGGYDTAEGRAGSFVLLLLIFITIVFSFFRSLKEENKQFVLVLVVTFLLFSFLIKAQSPINRLVMPYLLMWTPIVAVVLFAQSRRWLMVFPLLFFLASLPWLLDNKTRPLIRTLDWPTEGIQAYFKRQYQLYPSYDEATTIIAESACMQIGVVYEANSYFYEYPFWIMLHEKGYSGTIQHMMVENESSKYEDLQFSPCIILSNIELENRPTYHLEAAICTEGRNQVYYIYQQD